jgi:hypothetical protein
MDKIKYTYHHLGIPTKDHKPGERYSSTFKMYSSDGKDKNFRIEWHRFEAGCTLHPLLQTIPHLAFKVDSIDKAIKNKTVILEPYYPFEGFRVAAIEVDGAPIELIETNLNEDEIWDVSHENSVIYPK